MRSRKALLTILGGVILMAMSGGALVLMIPLVAGIHKGRYLRHWSDA